jgi:hypothetical protein
MGLAPQERWTGWTGWTGLVGISNIEIFWAVGCASTPSSLAFNHHSVEPTLKESTVTAFPMWVWYLSDSTMWRKHDYTTLNWFRYMFFFCAVFNLVYLSVHKGRDRWDKKFSMGYCKTSFFTITVSILIGEKFNSLYVSRCHGMAMPTKTPVY